MQMAMATAFGRTDTTEVFAALPADRWTSTRLRPWAQAMRTARRERDWATGVRGERTAGWPLSQMLPTLTPAEDADSCSSIAISFVPFGTSKRILTVRVRPGFIVRTGVNW